MNNYEPNKYNISERIVISKMCDTPYNIGHQTNNALTMFFINTKDKIPISCQGNDVQKC